MLEEWTWVRERVVFSLFELKGGGLLVPMIKCFKSLRGALGGGGGGGEGEGRMTFVF